MHSNMDMHLHILQRYDGFAKLLRLVCKQPATSIQSHATTTTSTLSTSTTTSSVYRKMKFIPKTSPNPALAQYSGISTLEDYIYDTKELLDKQLPQICAPHSDNLTPGQRKAINSLQRARTVITIKPADKNLGVVVMNTDDYMAQCTTLLKNQEVYRLAGNYPHQKLHQTIINTLVPFKEELKHINPHLYKYLLPHTNPEEIPKFYGIPKIHKKYTRLPPMRPIISQSCSPLMPSARFIDHILQPLAQSFDDYIQNSTSLILRLQDIHIPDTAVLVTIDVESLYPSIPQTECLKIVYEEMLNHRHLIITNPNLVIQLLHTNVNFNYFQFAGIHFQQIQGTAMGTAFSPTVANIFMSILIKNFLKAQSEKPLLLVRYIDDIFLIWPTKDTLNQFLVQLDNFHPNLKFTHSVSDISVNFLDLTIYKGPNFKTSHRLDLKTYQKPLNLYQYIEYTSAHPRNIYRSIILGECKRHLRNNTRPETFIATTTIFKKRLLKRKYPKQLTSKLIGTITFSERQKYLEKAKLNLQRSTPIPPLCKCPLLRHFNQLKTVILQNYNSINHLAPRPRFITLATPSLRKTLVRAEVKPTTDQHFDLLVSIESLPSNTPHIISGTLPRLRYNPKPPTIKPCYNPRCCTCTHLNCSPFFTSTVSRRRYPIRFAATCTSSNLIYLITCTKCKKTICRLHYHTTEQEDESSQNKYFER